MIMRPLKSSIKERNLCLDHARLYCLRRRLSRTISPVTYTDQISELIIDHVRGKLGYNVEAEKEEAKRAQRPPAITPTRPAVAASVAVVSPPIPTLARKAGEEGRPTSQSRDHYTFSYQL